MNVTDLASLADEETVLSVLRVVPLSFLWLLSALAAGMAAVAAAGHARAAAGLFRDWARRTPLPAVLAAVLCVADAVYVGGSKPPSGLTAPQLLLTQPGQASALTLMSPDAQPASAMPPADDGFVPPMRYTNTLTRAQYDAGFALTAVTNLQHDFAEPPSAEVADHVTAHGVHDEAYWIGLPNGFNAGGLEDRSRAVAAVCAAPSGMILLDDVPGRPEPAAPVFAGAATNRLLSVLQTPSGILPPDGRLWSAAESNGPHLVTWSGLMLGRLSGAKADLQCRLHPEGDFEYFIRPRTGADLSAVTRWLVAAQDAGGGETFAFATDAPLSAALPADGTTLALRWTAFGRLDPAVPDTDADGLTDWEELFVYRTSLRNIDTDLDGLEDGEEVLKYGTDPLKPDSLGDGTNDFWRVVDAASLTNTPWAEGGDGLALLTLETGLDAAAGVAALRIGDTLVPVLPGTSRTARVAIPRGVDVPFALIPGPGTAADDADITAVDASPVIVAYDASSVFQLPDETSAATAMEAAVAPLAATASTGCKRGSLHGVNYVLTPQPLCPHTGNGTLSVQPVTALPKDVSAIGFSAGSFSPTHSVTEEWLETEFPDKAANPGMHTVLFGVTLGVLSSGDAKVLGKRRETVSAHLCVFTSGTGEGEEDPAEGQCPCCTGGSCPCRCESKAACTCEICRDPYRVNAPTNSAGRPVGTEDRTHRLLLAQGAPDAVRAGPSKGTGISPLSGACTLCGCPHSEGGGGPKPAVIYRRTPNLSAVPAGGFAATSGVFTWKAGSYYSRGRYTVVRLGAGFSGAPPDAPPRVQADHTNVLTVTTQLPTNSAGTVSFSDHTFVAAVTVLNRRTGLHEALQSSYGAAEWRASYLSAGHDAELRYAATAAGQYGFTVTYTQPGATPDAVSTNLSFEAVRLLSEPVTAATDPATGFVYNPGGMPLGGTDRFRIEVAEGSVPAADITWTVKSGAACVSLAGGNTGPEVAVHADAAGAFTLEADVKGLVVTSPNVRPFFSGVVRPAVTVPVTVWIVRDDLGVTRARDPSDISGLLADANKILRQNGLTLAQSGQTRFADKDAWLNPSTATAAAEYDFDELMDRSTNTCGVELYFVQTITSTKGPANGMWRAKGVAVASGGTAGTIAHEVLHGCGLADIYPQIKVGSDPIPLSLPDVCVPAMLPSDWGGGYYEPGLLQKFVVASLIMSPGGYTNVPLPRADVPSGWVWGYREFSTQGNPSDELELRNVGLAGNHQNPVSQ